MHAPSRLSSQWKFWSRRIGSWRTWPAGMSRFPLTLAMLMFFRANATFSIHIQDIIVHLSVWDTCRAQDAFVLCTCCVGLQGGHPPQHCCPLLGENGMFFFFLLKCL